MTNTTPSSLNTQRASWDYEVSYQYERRSLREANFEFNYDITIKHLKSEGETHHVEVNRTNISPVLAYAEYNYATELAQKCGEVLYPIKLIISNTGQIESILNHQDILTRWKEALPRISLYYVGDAAKDYIDHTEQQLTNPKSITEALNTDLFLSLYFGILYQNNALNHQFLYTLPLNISENKILAFQVEDITQEKHLKKIKINGIWKDENHDQRPFFLKIDDIPYIKVSIQYLVEAETNFIQSFLFDAEINIPSQEDTHIKITANDAEPEGDSF